MEASKTFCKIKYLKIKNWILQNFMPYIVCVHVFIDTKFYTLATETELCVLIAFLNFVLSKNEWSLKMAKIQTHQLIFLFHVNKHLMNMNIAVYTV